jgi:predicted DsbA family dithiol-disulfide isomerase
MVTLDIVSDPICPWCLIGKARLDRALADRPGVVDIVWRPFQLNPDMPAAGMERAAYLEAKFGAGNATRFYDRIASAAAEAGVEVRFDRIRRTPNTLDAHRLIRWARATGRQSAVVASLFRRYFCDGEDISGPAVLVAAAVEAGMDGRLVAELLAGDADREAVTAEDGLARRMGVTGVPTFVIGGRRALVGAQDEATWARVLDDVAALPISD